MINETRQILYDREFKLKFLGDGEWLDEPDIVEFEYEGINCAIIRVIKREIYCSEEAYFGGHLCGYIFVPKGHYLYGKKNQEIDLDCWCGITWADHNDKRWMIGFDCAHCGDLVPSMVELRKHYPIPDDPPIPEQYKNYSIFNPTYKNIDFCIEQCKYMAKQAANIKEKNEESRI